MNGRREPWLKILIGVAGNWEFYGTADGILNVVESNLFDADFIDYFAKM